jgi:hypothetical protein
MPGSFIGEVVVNTLAEIVLRIVGYCSGRILVGAFSFGRAYVEPAPKGVRFIPRWHGFSRDFKGKIVVGYEMGTFIGLLFWAVAVAVGLLIHRFA